MRLLSTSQVELRDFLGEIPPYAILSHTWGLGEVLFHDVQNHTAASKAGYQKLMGSCQKARQDGFDWIWIDTCCIDKSSSAELTESINSMYQWYEASTVCYAYLADVEITPLGGVSGIKEQIRKSRWFSRGWTLQELIAPRTVVFYTVDWVELGTKSSLPNLLSSITEIPVRVLLGDPPSSCSIAERMSWASRRQTTRLEDAAYCLLGVFDVNMPMLYGEGRKAFARLQENILKKEEDYSILAWTLQRDCGKSLAGLLASSPSEFSNETPQELRQPINNEHMDRKGEPKVENQDESEEAQEQCKKVRFADDEEKKKKKKRVRSDHFAARFLDLAIEGDSQQASDLCVIFEKRYCDMRLYRPRYQAIASLAPKSPPHISSRGVHVTLPVARLWETEDSNAPMLAWIYTEFEDRLICILLQESSKVPGLVGRRSSPWLISIERSFMDRFVATELVVHPSGEIDQDTYTPGACSTVHHPAPRWGRIKVDLEDRVALETQLISVWPPKLWNTFDELIFTYQQGAVGVLVFEVAQTARKIYRVRVVFGFVNQRHWCHAESWWESPQRDDPLDTLETYYEKLRNDNLRGPDIPKIDRSTTALPGLIVSASMRETASLFRYSNAFLLQVTVAATGSQDIWSSMQLRDDAG